MTTPIDISDSPILYGAPDKFTDWRPGQEDALLWALSSTQKHVGLGLATGTGKCERRGSRVLMGDGSIKTVEEVRVGESLMGMNGERRKVLSTVSGSDRMVEIRPMKGESWFCTRDHILTLIHTQTNELIDITVEEYLQQTKTFRHLHKLIRSGVEFPEREYEIDPYFLGVLLGDGHLAASPPGVTSKDPEIENEIREQATHWGLSVHMKDDPTRCPTYFLTTTRKGGSTPNPLTVALRKLDLCRLGESKFVPFEYKTGSRSQRLEILAGLLDTDGYLGNNTFEFVSMSRQLADDVCYLSRSVGLAAYPREKTVNGKSYWRVFISGDVAMIPTHLPRKQAAPRRQRKDALRTSFTVHDGGWGEYFGFVLDGDQRYLRGDFTVTHNSLVAYLLAKMLPGRTCILTSRIGLAHQYKKEFPMIAEVHGHRNYSSKEKYRAAVAVANNAQVVVTNYQYYFHSVSAGKIGHFDYIIADEAALAFREFSNFLSFEAVRDDLAAYHLGWPIDPNDVYSWRDWARSYAIPRAQAQLEYLAQDSIENDELQSLVASLRPVAEMSGRWVCENNGDIALVGNVWPGENGDIYLYPHWVKQVYYMSGTLRPHSLELLGAKPHEIAFREWPHPFPQHIRPVAWIPTVRMTERTLTPYDWRLWVTRLDQMIDWHEGELGLIHTVSYKRAQQLLESSEHNSLMVTHTPRNVQSVVDEFLTRRGTGTHVLLSPTLVAGWDLAEVSWQCIGKIPFPVGTDAISQARNADRPDFMQFEVAQDLVQQAGRIVRGPNEEDRGITYIADDNWHWFGHKNAAAMPDWFKVEKRLSFIR